MPRPDRVPVVDALGVVPHPVAVHEAAACGFADAEHAPVDVLRHAGDQVLRRGAEAGGPMLANEVVVGADPAAGDDHGLGPELERADLEPRARRAACGGGRLQHGAAHPGDHAVGEDQLVHAAAELELHPARGDRRPHPPFERLDDARPGAPRDVEAGHRVAVAVGEVAAALGPADDREEPHAHPGSHDRFSPAAKSTYAVAHWRAQKSSPAGSSTPRSKPAEPSQSCRARSAESRTPRRRCSGESTRNSPPNDQNACPPRLAAGSWSSRITRLPASASSAVAASPASPAPTTMTSVSTCSAWHGGVRGGPGCRAGGPGAAAPWRGWDAVPAGARRHPGTAVPAAAGAVPADGRGGTPGVCPGGPVRQARRRARGGEVRRTRPVQRAAPQQGGEVDVACGKIAARGTWRPWRGPPCAVRGDLPRGGPCGRRPARGVRAWSGGPRPGRGGRPGPPAPAWACGRGSR